MKLNAFAVVAVLVIGAFATGCGSSDDSSDSTTTASLTKAQWIAQADAICKTGNDKTNAAAHQQFQQRPTAQQIEQFTTDTIDPRYPAGARPDQGARLPHGAGEPG